VTCVESATTEHDRWLTPCSASTQDMRQKMA
jgi:hypothetical protein